MKYQRIFNTVSEYEEVKPDLNEPIVSYTRDDNKVRYGLDLHIGYIEIEIGNSDPSAVTKTDEYGVIDEILSKFHRVLGKYTANGEITICQLDDTDSNKYINSTVSDLTGTDGDVFVYFPTFYYKGEEIEGKYRFNFSLDPIKGYHEAKESLVGAYKAYVDQEKLYSISGVESTGDISMPDFSTYARNRGKGYHIIDYQQHCIIAWMFYCKYLTRNSQEKCGTGKNSYSGLNCGSTNSLGMKDTTSSNASSSSNMLVNFLGIEGCWGYKYEWIEGIHTHSSDGVIVYDKGDYHDQRYSSVNSDTKRILVTGSSKSGWISEIYSGDYMDMVGKTYSGSDSTYFCDSGNVYPSFTYVFYRSCYNDGTDGGVSYLRGNYSSSVTSSVFGSRLAFDGSIVWNNDPDSYKSLPVFDPDVEYIEFDSSNSDPSNITKVGSEGGVIDQILSKFHRVLAKNTADGQVTMCQLDDTDSNKCSDGSNSVLDGTQGDIMVYFPTFYYKGETTEKGYKFNFSLKEKEGYHKANESLVGVYKADLSPSDSKMYSRCKNNSIPARGTFETYSTYARNRGTGYHIIDYQQHCIIAWMFYCKYLTRNSKSKCGFTGPYGELIMYIGSSNNIGMKDTTLNVDLEPGLVNFLGIESCWGGFAEYIEGIHLSGSDVIVYDKGNFYPNSYNEIDSDAKRKFNLLDKSGLIKDIHAGEYMDMLPKELSDDEFSLTYYCDLSSIKSIPDANDLPFYRSGNGTQSSVYNEAVEGISALLNLQVDPSKEIVGMLSSRLAFDGELLWNNNYTEFSKLSEYTPSPKIGYIEFDSSNPDPANITKVDGQVIDKILSKFHRVLGKSDGNGNMVICQLDDSNSNKYSDGEVSDLTGGEGDVFVYFPTFYYKGETTEKGYRFNFSLDPIEGYHEAKESLVGVYKGYIDGEKLYSKSGVEATKGKSFTNFSTYAKSRGTGYHLIDYQEHCILCWMFYTKYLTRDSQSKCGTGPNKDKGINNGSTNSLGMKDTTPDINDTDTLVNFLGVEGCWGYMYEWIEGIHSCYEVNDVTGIQNSEYGVIVYDKGDYHDQKYSLVTSPTKRLLKKAGILDTPETSGKSGYISEIYAGEYMDMLGKEFSGSDSTYFCDSGSIDQANMYVFNRSFIINNSSGGVSSLYNNYSSSSDSSSYVNCSSRLAFDGNITWISKSSEYKSKIF